MTKTRRRRWNIRQERNRMQRLGVGFTLVLVLGVLVTLVERAAG
jgi:hypothetical protein